MAGSLRFGRRPGVSRTFALAVAVLLVISVGGAGVVLYLSQTPSTSGGASSTSTTTTSSSSGSPGAASTSSSVGALSATSSGLASTSSIACPNDTSSVAGFGGNSTMSQIFGNLTGSVGELNASATPVQLFGNFSQMTLRTELSGVSGGVTLSSFQVVGRPVIGSLEYYEVNFTTSSFGFNDSSTALFAPNGTATSVSSGMLGSFSGAAAAAAGEGYLSPFLSQLGTSAFAGSIAAQPGLAILNQTTASLGPTSVKVTYYTLENLPLTYCGATLTSLVEGLAAIPGTGLTMIVYNGMQVSDQGSTFVFASSVDSIALASR